MQPVLPLRSKAAIVYYTYTETDSGVRQRRKEMQWVTRIANAIDEDQLLLYAQKNQPAAG